MKDLTKGRLPYQNLLLVPFLYFTSDFLGRLLAKRNVFDIRAYLINVFPPFILITNPLLKVHPAQL